MTLMRSTEGSSRCSGAPFSRIRPFPALHTATATAWRLRPKHCTICAAEGAGAGRGRRAGGRRWERRQVCVSRARRGGDETAGGVRRVERDEEGEGRTFNGAFGAGAPDIAQTKVTNRENTGGNSF